MKLVAAAAVLVAVVLCLAGCGSQSTTAQRPTNVTINLPTSGGSSSFRGTVASGSRRVFGHPSRAAQTESGASQATDIAPLTAQANARLNGVSVWIPYWGLTAATDDAIANASVIQVAHPFTDEIEGVSTVVDQSGGASTSVSQQLAAKHITVIPTVTETDQMTAFNTTLGDRQKRTALLKSLESIATEPGNSGIDLDFENMAVGSGDVKQAEQLAGRFPVFVGQLCAVLHRTNHSCEVTVMARDDSGHLDNAGLNNGVYDYAKLAAVADRVQVMAYDYHVPSGAAGPIAPWSWVKSVIHYALGQVPADKLVLGVPAYGAEWNSDGGGSSLTATAATSLAASVGASIQWSEADAEPYYNYTTKTTTRHKVTVKQPYRAIVMIDRKARTVTRIRKVQKVRTVTRPVTHTVWFEDSTADYDRAVLAADDKLAGIAVWAGGDESPGLWTMLKKVEAAG